MKVIREIDNFIKTNEPIYVALGNFDGVHKGHQKLINSLVKKAKSNNGVAAAFIFEPHPIQVLNPAKAPDLLNTADIKAELLEKMGIDILIYNTFSSDISRCSPEQFVQEFLVGRLALQEVFVGFNYSFGHKGVGTPELLKEFGKKYGFEVNIIPSVEVEHTAVSSTRVRKMLDHGDINKAHDLLGYYPILEGIIVEEEHRGTAIGFPTANLLVEKGIQKPAKGVYAAFASLDGEKHRAVVNIGSKPTFHEEYPVSIEAHIIDFNQNIYGKRLRLHFVARIRDEMKFAGIEELVKQISADRTAADEILLECSGQFYISNGVC